MVEKKDDQGLDEYLQGDTALSRRYRDTSKAAPPGHVDDAILAAARKSVGSRPQSVRPAWLRRWSRPVSIAAVLVVCVSLVFTIYDEEQHQVLTEPAMNEAIPDSAPLKEKASDSRTPAATFDDTARQENRHGVVESEEMILDSDAPVGNRGREQTDTRDVLKKEAPQQPGEKRLRQESADKLQREPATLSKDVVPAIELREEIAAEAIGETTSDEQAWLTEIARLWQAGEKDRAITGLEQFIATYPDYPRDDIVMQLPEEFDPAEHIKEFELD